MELPGFWRFLWLFWMQPITLNRLFSRLEIDPHASTRDLLSAQPVHWWIIRSAQSLFLVAPATGVAVAGAIAAYGIPVSLLRVAFCAAFGAAIGAAFGAACGLDDAVAFGAAIGVAIGLAVGAAGGVIFCVTFSVAYGMAFEVVVANYGLANDPLFRFFGAIGRLPFYLFETLIQLAARFINAITRSSTLSWCPVLYHELSYIPHPFLERHLLAEADSAPELTRRVLEACAIAPGQRGIRRRVEAKLRDRELTWLVETNDFQAIAELRGYWLPGIQGANGLQLSFSEAARYLVAAKAAFNPHRQLKHLVDFEAKLNAIKNQSRSHPALQPLHLAGQKLRVIAERNASEKILNPFRTGNPLSAEEGPELFRGREDAVHEIEEILADSNRSASLLLLAPRRAGKTSLLKMLPSMLPDTVCVFFDLQAHPASSVWAFWTNLANEAIIQAKRDRRIDLPKFPDGPPMEAAAAWLAKLDHVLIAIDEFERLEALFPGSLREFLQLMGLFRATIQHRRGVRLLVSGAAPFEELDRVWDDHFISARQIKLPFLDLPTSIGLLTQPSPEFPSNVITEEVARKVHQRTGGQPYLLQVFGSLLVDRLNNGQPADVEAVEDRAIEWAESYFREMYKSAPEAARQALDRMSLGQPADPIPAARRWLAQRYLITADDLLSIPIFGAWITQYVAPVAR